MAFNLADVLKEVPYQDTGREQIEYIPLNQIDEDPNNFYQLTDLDGLAENISLCGLQQPIRVRQKDDGRYIIVSGHRRRAALEMLVQDDPERWKEVSCIVERDAVSPALQQLRLIFANANTRKMSSAEISQQAEEVEKLLYQLKEEGYEFPGRMRDHVAEAVSVSKSKLARLKVIRENLAACWADDWKNGTIGESVAYNLSQMPKSWQTVVHNVWGDKANRLYADTVANAKLGFQNVTKIQCKHGLNLCEHTVAMMEKNCKEMHCLPCTVCCFDCSSLQNCKNCCPEAAAQKKKLRDTAKAANQKAKAEQEERDRPGAEFARLVWERIGNARLENRVSIEALHKAQKKMYIASHDDKRQRTMESGNGKYDPNTDLPFGYSMSAASVMKIRDVADALGCSIDYLLGRTDRMEVVSDSDTVPAGRMCPNPGTGWQTGDPAVEGRYILLVRYDVHAPTYLEEWDWDNRHGWQDESQLLDADIVEVMGWIPFPKLPGTEVSG